MALDLPIVSTRLTGIPEIVGDDAGLLVEPRDPDALAVARCHLQSSGLRPLVPARRRGTGRRMTLADVARLRSGVTG